VGDGIARVIDTVTQWADLQRRGEGLLAIGLTEWVEVDRRRGCLNAALEIANANGLVILGLRTTDALSRLSRFRLITR
jgi:hypothetical protein